MDGALKSLHGHRVTVECDIQGQAVSVSGSASYSAGKLEIDVANPAGNFTIILDDATWAGSIRTDDAGGYVVRVA